MQSMNDKPRGGLWGFSFAYPCGLKCALIILVLLLVLLYARVYIFLFALLYLQKKKRHKNSLDVCLLVSL